MPGQFMIFPFAIVVPGDTNPRNSWYFMWLADVHVLPTAES